MKEKKSTTKKPASAAKKAEEKKTAKKAEEKKPAAKAAKPAAEKKAPAEKKAAAKPAPQKVEEAPAPAEKNNIILLTDEPAKPAGGRYVIIMDESNSIKPYKFQLKANNGQVLYESEGYKVKPKKASINAFKKAVEQGTIAIDKEKNGTYRYKLYKADSNNTLLGVGESYSTKARAESSAESVKAFAASANFIEDLTITD